jgi:hypothetical protein
MLSFVEGGTAEGAPIELDFAVDVLAQGVN